MKKYIKAPYTTVGIQNNILFIGFGSIQKEVVDPQIQTTALKILNEFTSAKTHEEVKIKLSSEPKFQESFDLILNGHFLIEDGLYDKTDRFSRAKLYYNLQGNQPLKAQELLSQVKVGIIGCGGIGNLVSVNLATAGVKKFLLCDNDEIEASNLSRQIMFTESDMGKLKGPQLASALKSRASYVDVQTIQRKVFSPDDLLEFKDCDLLVVSADKGNVVNVVNKFSVQYKVPYINVGYVNDIAVWGPMVVPGKTGCYSCQDIIAGDSTQDNIRQLMQNINKGYQAPSVGPVNMLSSSLASLDIINFLIGEDDIQTYNKRIGLWTHNLKFETQNCEKNELCKVCS